MADCLTVPASVALSVAQTPSELVKELNRFIVGQGEAKKAVAVALRQPCSRTTSPTSPTTSLSSFSLSASDCLLPVCVVCGRLRQPLASAPAE